MQTIVPDIDTLVQHQQLLKEDKERYRPKPCPCCSKAGVWFHGYYERKADRSNTTGNTLNPVFIPRFFCPECRKSGSSLPECIPPRRWYLWAIQQWVIAKQLLKCSVQSIASGTPQVTNTAISRSTIRRWWGRLSERFVLQRDALCAHLNALSPFVTVVDFWQACLEQLSLAQAMYRCHVAGVVVP